jgi:hypothetical protein
VPSLGVLASQNKILVDEDNVLYLDASNLLQPGDNPSDGTAISSWKDISGYYNHANQETGANQPTFETNEINGEPVTRFDGADDRFVISNSESMDGIWDTGGTMFIVLDWVSAGENNNGRWIKAEGGTPYLNIFNATATGTGCRIGFEKAFSGDNLNFRTNNESITFGQTTIVCFQYDASSTSNRPTFYVNSKTAWTGTQTVSAPTGTVSSDVGADYEIGNYGGVRTIDGDISHLSLYNTSLGTTARDDIMDDLATKYGVTLS